MTSFRPLFKFIYGVERMKKNIIYKVSLFFLIALTVSIVIPGCTQKEEETETVITTSPLPESELLRTEDSGDFVFAVYEDYVEVTGYSGTSETVTVPELYDNTRIMSIGKSAFEGNSSVKYVVLSSNVVNIDTSAFSRCKNLESIDMPGVRSISPSAFKDSGLRSVELPSVLENLGRYSFSGTSLEIITLPGSIVRSGDYVFSGCTSLKSVTFDEGFPEVSSRMFSGCTALTEVVISKGIKTIGDYAFAYCTGLKKVTVPSETAVKDGAFYGISNLTICSESGSSAESYSKKYNVTFEVVS